MDKDQIDSDVEILEVKLSGKFGELKNHKDSNRSSMQSLLEQIEKCMNEILSK
ncbi:hypothetical protein TIFTF001_000858 [Ficus carica]|uniref:Uncharacterized protein n=1 Tax=Ficus carica TaxID=3494 RepID=A0AA88CNZ6_FICCA|nr:hypothetical protein TIFTF001_000858 [Ficus carica]